MLVASPAKPILLTPFVATSSTDATSQNPDRRQGGCVRQTALSGGGFHDVKVETFAHDVRFSDGTLFATLNAMAVIGMTEKGKKLNEGERGELAGHIAAESHAIIARYTKHGEFVIPLSTNIATARA
jgi:hypothetical protein